MKLLVYGSGEFAIVVRDLAQQCGHEVSGFIDDFNVGPGILGDFDAVRLSYRPEEFGIAIGVGYKDLGARWSVFETVTAFGYAVPPLIHPRAYVRDSGLVGEGSFIMAGSIVDVGASVGELTVVWPGVVINHDSRIERNVFLSPNATICGSTVVNADSFIGAGAVVCEHRTVPARSFVKAGTVFS